MHGALVPLEFGPCQAYNWSTGTARPSRPTFLLETTMNLIRRTPSALSTWRPRGIDDPFGRLVEHMFEDMLSPFTQAGALSPLSPEGTASPRMNISETDKAFEVQAELPGVNKDDVKVAIDHQRVTIEAETKTEREQRGRERAVRRTQRQQIHAQLRAAGGSRRSERPGPHGERRSHAQPAQKARQRGHPHRHSMNA
ncbi:Hsp20/alpha crystallin family protein [Massilia sp. B-10]|nr:Hsp20/alpha crystallin family protein [Massilia sp. B-10]UUZ53947.1 Hsp20/alpha crystallin family protein [Massilia sp. H-1]